MKAQQQSHLTWSEDESQLAVKTPLGWAIMGKPAQSTRPLSQPPTPEKKQETNAFSSNTVALKQLTTTAPPPTPKPYPSNGSSPLRGVTPKVFNPTSGVSPLRGVNPRTDNRSARHASLKQQPTTAPTTTPVLQQEISQAQETQTNPKPKKPKSKPRKRKPRKLGTTQQTPITTNAQDDVNA